jgi:hypothetical protein
MFLWNDTFIEKSIGDVSFGKAKRKRGNIIWSNVLEYAGLKRKVVWE